MVLSTILKLVPLPVVQFEPLFKLYSQLATSAVRLTLTVLTLVILSLPLVPESVTSAKLGYVAVTVPLVAASRALACATVIAPVTVRLPVWLVMPVNALTKLAAVSKKLAAIVALLRVIAPIVALLIATNSATVAGVGPVIVTASLPRPVTLPAVFAA